MQFNIMICLIIISEKYAIKGRKVWDFCPGGGW